MTLEITTPALLFPATSLLLLAYTNRYLALATVVRDLSSNIVNLNVDNAKSQIQTLYHRIILIRYMQLCGASSLLLCVFSMVFIWFQWQPLGEVFFGLSLFLMGLSLLIALREIGESGAALKLELQEMERRHHDMK
jgi:hypothetical protein